MPNWQFRQGRGNLRYRKCNLICELRHVSRHDFKRHALCRRESLVAYIDLWERSSDGALLATLRLHQGAKKGENPWRRAAKRLSVLIWGGQLRSPPLWKGARSKSLPISKGIA